MKLIFILLVLCLPVMAEPSSARSIPAAGRVKVVVTVYWAIGRGTDPDTKRFRSAEGTRLKEGVSVAVDPAIFPYGTKLEIEGIGLRVAMDTGTDVVAREAAKNRGVNHPVIDVFFRKREDALKFATKFELSHGNVTYAKPLEEES